MRMTSAHWKLDREATKKTLLEKEPTAKIEVYKDLEIQTWDHLTSAGITLYDLRIYTGTAGKHTCFYYYRDAATRDRAVAEWKKGADSREAYKAERKEAKKVCGNFKVGDILTCSWGYDQTNIDFYEVIKTTGASVVIRKIAKDREEETGFMSGTCTPNPGHFIGEPMTKRVGGYKNPDGTEHLSVKISSYSSAYLWDGKPEHWTAYA